MQKLIAILTVVSWSGFWSFGYIALMADGLSQSQILMATTLAGLGFLTGVGAYLALSRGQAGRTSTAQTINKTAWGYRHAAQEG